MRDEPKSEPSKQPSAETSAGASAPPAPAEHSEDLAPAERALDAGLLAAFEGDSGPPLAAGDSVLQALEAAAPGSVPRVHLRVPDDEPATPVALAASEELPQDFP